MKNFSEQEKEKLLNNYLNIHGDSYTSSNIKILKKEFGKLEHDYMAQIYYALHLLTEEENPYLAFTELVEKEYGLDLNILEVCGGIYPALSYEIAKKQLQIGKGTITVYDELLSKRLESKKIILQRKTFTKYNNIDNYDLVISKEPCHGTFAVIESTRNKKDLILSPCKCYSLLPGYIDYLDNPLEQWYEFVYYLLEDDKSTIDTKYLDSKVNYSNPVYCKKLIK